jgi:ATP-dependent Clp endopeptidase proteolytic subunit ClpP
MESREAATRDKDEKSSTSNIKRIENHIYFTDRITMQTAHQLNVLLKTCELEILADMKEADDVVKKSKAKYTRIRIEPKPVYLTLSTNGGLIHAAFSVVDTIRSLRVPVHTIVNGYVASAGTLISLAGNYRFITPNSFMMIHEIRSGFWGRYSDARTEYENVSKLMEHVINYYAERTKITKERLREMLRSDNDMTAAEALEHGLVDEIERVTAYYGWS